MALALPAAIPHPLALHSVDRGGAGIVAIVAHDTGNPKPGASSLSTLYSGDGRGVSIHALINRDGSYYRLVPDTRGANHAGAKTAVLRLNGREWRAGAINRATLGFELERSEGEPFYPDAQLRTMGALIADWRQRWGALPIVPHRDIDPTRRADPRDLTVAQIEAWASAAVAPAPPSSPITPDAPLLSPPRCTLAQAQRAYAAHGPHGAYTQENVGSVILPEYWRLCPDLGLDPCLAVAQMAHETGYEGAWLASFWASRPQRNPAGLGVDGTKYAHKPANSIGFKFNTQRQMWEKGLSFGGWLSDSIPAHIGRLLAFALPPGTGTPAQRAMINRALAYRALPDVARGSAPVLRLLGKVHNPSGYGWASPGELYGVRIAAIMNEMRAL